MVMTTRRSAELLQTGELSLSLSEFLCKVTGLCDGGSCFKVEQVRIES